jgi:tetratricopeptide (TPR) repeat protein
MKSYFLIAVISVFVAGVSPAQPKERGQGFTVRGEVSTIRPLVGGYTVELVAGTGIRQTVPVAGDGSFEFQAAEDGAQELRVIDPRGTVIHEQPVFINGPHQLLAIRLPDNPNTPRSPMNTVSVQQLQHKVPPLAKKAFDRGEQAVVQAKYQEAIEAFQQALAIDPEYADGLNELGVAQAATGDLTHAAENFQKAVDLVPDHAAALPNLSVALAKLRRFHEAGEVARRALKVAPDSGPVRYILAASILVEHGDPEEALANLERACDTIPKAHLVAADVLINLKRPDEAIKHLEAYLRVAPPDDKDRAMAEERLAQLRH